MNLYNNGFHYKMQICEFLKKSQRAINEKA